MNLICLFGEAGEERDGFLSQGMSQVTVVGGEGIRGEVDRDLCAACCRVAS